MCVVTFCDSRILMAELIRDDAHGRLVHRKMRCISMMQYVKRHLFYLGSVTSLIHRTLLL